MNNVVSLTNGINTVDFSILRVARGNTIARMHNSKHEVTVLELTEAQDRIRTLKSAGWKILAAR